MLLDGDPPPPRLRRPGVCALPEIFTAERWGTLNGQARFITGWHWSASQSYENVYDWDGKMFRQTSHILYQYDPDGNRKEIEEPNYVPKDKAPKLADPQR